MKIWATQLLQLALLIFLTATVNRTTGYFLYSLLFICLVFIIHQSILLAQLENWLKQGAKANQKPQKNAWKILYSRILNLTKTDKKRKKRLNNIISKYSKATATLPDAIVILGQQQTIQWFNNSAKLTLGLKKEHKGHSIISFLNHPDATTFFQDPNAKNSLLTLASPSNKDLILEIKVLNYEIDSQLLVAHDVTYLKNIERMRTDFVDNISHELRTPLTVLKGYIETLEDMEVEQSPLLSHSLQQMNAQTQRMQYLVDDLLLLANLETQKIDSDCVDIAALLAQIYQETQAVESTHNRVELIMNSDINILGNEQELRSAFTNLINNALKYSPADSMVKVKWIQVKEAVILEVIDHGEGIPKDDIPKITERFYRVDVKRQQETRGTGLGLAIVKHVLNRHDAKLTIHSELNKGSRFRCLFPKQRCC